MSTYYSVDDFSTNDVSGAIAVAVLRDLHVNNHCLTGFPAVEISEKDRVFTVHLQLSGKTSRPINISYPEAKQLGRDFQKQKPAQTAWVKKVQEMVLDLERQSSQ